MGAKDSSKTRVAPVFDRLVKHDPRGGWLLALLHLPRRFDGCEPEVPTPGHLQDAAWHPEERELLPPRQLLCHLVKHPDLLRPPANLGSDSELTRALRRRLLDGDLETRAEALLLLQQSELPPRTPNSLKCE